MALFSRPRNEARSGGPRCVCTIAALCRCIVLLAALLLPWGAQAQVAPLDLGWGPTSIDLNDDGRPDLVVKGWREMHNGAGFTTWQFLVNVGPGRVPFPQQRPVAPTGSPPPPAPTAPKTPPPTPAAPQPPRDLWEVVAIEDPVNRSFLSVLTESESGPCTLRRAVVLNRPGLGTVLVVAERREPGDAFAQAPIAVDFFALLEDTKAVAGEPSWAFKRRESVTTRGRYCDAGLALDALLAGRD